MRLAATVCSTVTIFYINFVIALSLSRRLVKTQITTSSFPDDNNISLNRINCSLSYCSALFSMQIFAVSRFNGVIKYLCNSSCTCVLFWPQRLSGQRGCGVHATRPGPLSSPLSSYPFYTMSSVGGLDDKI